MSIKNPNRCLICDQNRLHGGNKKLAALHSRMTKELAEQGKFDNSKPPKKAPYPDRYSYANGKRVVL